MPSLYRRVQHIQFAYRKPPLSTEQLCDLGKIVMAEYWQVKPQKTPVRRKEYPEEPGMRVIDYPRNFISEIDRIVLDYYRNSLPQKPIRTRKFVPKPAFQARKTTYQSNG